MTDPIAGLRGIARKQNLEQEKRARRWQFMDLFSDVLQEEGEFMDHPVAQITYRNVAEKVYETLERWAAIDLGEHNLSKEQIRKFLQWLEVHPNQVINWGFLDQQIDEAIASVTDVPASDQEATNG